MIVNQRTAVCVTRDRAQGRPAYDNSPPLLKDKGESLDTVFVRRDREPENCRVRDSDKHRYSCVPLDQGWSPAQTIIPPSIKFEAYYRYGRGLARKFLKDKGKGIKDKKGRNRVRGSWSCSHYGKNVIVSRKTTVTVVRARKTTASAELPRSLGSVVFQV